MARRWSGVLYTPTHLHTRLLCLQRRLEQFYPVPQRGRVRKQWQECALMYDQHALHYDLPGNDPLIPQNTLPSCSRIPMKGNKTEIEMVFQEILPLFNCSFKDFCHFPAADQKKKIVLYSRSSDIHTDVQVQTINLSSYPKMCPTSFRNSFSTSSHCIEISH